DGDCSSLSSSLLGPASVGSPVCLSISCSAQYGRTFGSRALSALCGRFNRTGMYCACPQSCVRFTGTLDWNCFIHARDPSLILYAATLVVTVAACSASEFSALNAATKSLSPSTAAAVYSPRMSGFGTAILPVAASRICQPDEPFWRKAIQSRPCTVIVFSTSCTGSDQTPASVDRSNPTAAVAFQTTILSPTTSTSVGVGRSATSGRSGPPNVAFIR